MFNVSNKNGREKLLHFNSKSQKDEKARQPISVIRRQQIDGSFRSLTQRHSITNSKLNPDRIYMFTRKKKKKTSFQNKIQKHLCKRLLFSLAFNPEIKPEIKLDLVHKEMITEMLPSVTNVGKIHTRVRACTLSFSFREKVLDI